MEKKRKIKRTELVFVPQPMYIDTVRFQKDKNLAIEKMATYKAIQEWCRVRINMDNVNMEAFIFDTIEEFKKVYAEENKGVANVVLSFEKLSFLTDLNIKPLEGLAQKFHSNKMELRVVKGKVQEPIIKEKSYTQWTLSDEDNKKMDIIKRLNEVVEDAEAFNRVSKGQLASLFPFVQLEHRTNKFVMARSLGRR
tara:strand:- start:2370 stop:2954 length:585 start_codon:yes stop_codon:yes gene_type:complete